MLSCWYLLSSHFMFKGLGPVPEGFVVTMRTQVKAVRPWDWTYRSLAPSCTVTTNPDRSVLIIIITWHFNVSPCMLAFCISRDNLDVEERTVLRYILPLLHHGPEPWGIVPSQSVVVVLQNNHPHTGQKKKLKSKSILPGILCQGSKRHNPN